jgi:hypothetical protein
LELRICHRKRSVFKLANYRLFALKSPINARDRVMPGHFSQAPTGGDDSNWDQFATALIEKAGCV